MAAPGEVVHFEERRVRELHQEDAVLGDRPHRRQVGLARQDMEGVEDEPDRRVVGAAHDLPGVAVVADVAAPGEGLVADAQAAFRRALAELAEIRGGAVDAAERIRRNIAAHEKEIAAELRHDVELALGAGERLAAVRLRHALEVAEGLEGDDLKPEVGGHPAHFGRGAVERQEIVLEDLDALELRGRDGLELLRQRAAQADGGDGGSHGLSVPQASCL